MIKKWLKIRRDRKSVRFMINQIVNRLLDATDFDISVNSDWSNGTLVYTITIPNGYKGVINF